jgi:hypothetical protein
MVTGKKLYIEFSIFLQSIKSLKHLLFLKYLFLYKDVFLFLLLYTQLSILANFYDVPIEISCQGGIPAFNVVNIFIITLYGV